MKGGNLRTNAIAAILGVMVSGSPHWIGPLIESTSYDPITDFSPISVLDRAPVILVVHPSMPVRSVRQLIALAKKRPGELNYGSGGPGGSNHLGAIVHRYARTWHAEILLNGHRSRRRMT